MGKNGCTIAPYLKPTEWTERYFNLREQIEEMEL